MAKTIGRLGYLGLGLENTPGSAVNPSVFVPYTDISLRGHHEPIEVQGTTTSRFMDRTSVIGKKWSEGDIAIDADTKVIGYLLKMAFGNEILTTGTPNFHDFYVTTSGNTPKTATMVFGRDTDIEQYTYVAVNELTLEVSDGLATIKTSVMGAFPTTGSAQTPTVTSGTVLAFPTFEARIGADLSSASGASATPLNDFSLTIANNLEMIYQTGQSSPTAIRNKGMQVTGSYTVYFDSVSDRDAYYNLNKRAMEIKLTGNSSSDALRFRIPRFRLSEGEISTGIDDFFMMKANFTVEDAIGAGAATVDSGVRMIDARLTNDLGTTY